jgi:hypothetical protein
MTYAVPSSHRVLLRGLGGAAGYGQDLEGPLFRPVKNNTTKQLRKLISPRSVLRDMVQQYAQKIGLAKEAQGLCTHSLRVTGATNALDHGADSAEVQMWDQWEHSNRNIRFRFKVVLFQEDTVTEIIQPTSKCSLVMGSLTH